MEDTRLQFALKIAIAKSVLKDGAYYGGKCRNANIARWNAAAGVFVHWRTKFTSFFTETIQHPEDAADNRFDYFLPLFEIAAPEYPIPFDNEPVDRSDKEAYYAWSDRVRDAVLDRLKEETGPN